MIVNCELIAGYKKKGEKDDRYYWGLKLHEMYNILNDPNLDILYEFRIVGEFDDGDSTSVLASKRFVDDKMTTHYLHFHTISYAYSCRDRLYYCITTRHNI